MDFWSATTQKRMITIIDYKAGNLASIQNMLRKIGIASCITDKEEEILAAEKLILPGVGSFDHGMQQLNRSGLRPALDKAVLENKVSILGICLGVQLFTRGSEEGLEPGLGWVEGRTKKFAFGDNPQQLKIPHMGWTEVSFSPEAALFKGMPTDSRFYFVHAYHLELERPEDEMVSTHYGYPFSAGLQHENIYGVQFHPEKSHKYGMQLLSNFAKL